MPLIIQASSSYFHPFRIHTQKMMGTVTSTAVAMSHHMHLSARRPLEVEMLQHNAIPAEKPATASGSRYSAKRRVQPRKSTRVRSRTKIRNLTGGEGVWHFSLQSTCPPLDE